MRETAEAELARLQTEKCTHEHKHHEKVTELASLQKRLVEVEAQGGERVEHARKAAQNSFRLQE